MIASDIRDQLARADSTVARVLRELDDLNYRVRLAQERLAARRWWMETATAAWARYGWDWPGPAAGGR